MISSYNTKLTITVDGVEREITPFHTTDGVATPYFIQLPEDKADFCKSVERSIPAPESKPTIEQLAADYLNAKDYADRKQKEADAAKADAEAKLYLVFNQPKREFEDIADEMIKWLCENGHPHMTVIITNTHAELVEGIRSCVNDRHLKR